MSNIFHIYFVRIPICLSQLFKMKCDGFYTGYGLEIEDLDVNDESRARHNIFCIIPYRENMSCKNLVTLSGEMSQVHAQLYCTDGNTVFGYDSDKNSLVIIYMF